MIEHDFMDDLKITIARQHEKAGREERLIGYMAFHFEMAWAYRLEYLTGMPVNHYNLKKLESDNELKNI